MAARRWSAGTYDDPRQLWLDLDMPLLPPLRPPSLPTSAPPPGGGKREDSVFFAILLGSTAAALATELLDRLQHRDGFGGRRRPTELLHVSLLRVGGYQSLPSDILDAALRGALIVDVPQFDVTFDRVASFKVGKGRHALVLLCNRGSAALAGLQETIVAGMKAVGLSVPPLPQFVPHMTLLYGRKPFPEMRLDKPITLKASDFALVRSLYGRSQYHILGQWPLRG